MWLSIVFPVLLAGNSQVNINVRNSGSAQTHTVIETTVNGSTSKIESEEPGSIRVENINGNVTVVKNGLTQNGAEFSTESSKPSSPAVTVKTEEEEPAPRENIPVLTEKILDIIVSYITKIKHFFAF